MNNGTEVISPTVDEFIRIAEEMVAQEEAELEALQLKHSQDRCSTTTRVLESACSAPHLETSTAILEKKNRRVANLKLLLEKIKDDSGTDCSQMGIGVFADILVKNENGEVLHDGPACVVNGKGEQSLGFFSHQTPLAQCLLGASPGELDYKVGDNGLLVRIRSLHPTCASAFEARIVA